MRSLSSKISGGHEMQVFKKKRVNNCKIKLSYLNRLDLRLIKIHCYVVIIIQAELK